MISFAREYLIFISIVERFILNRLIVRVESRSKVDPECRLLIKSLIFLYDNSIRLLTKNDKKIESESKVDLEFRLLTVPRSI